MSGVLYPAIKEEMLNKLFGWASDTMELALYTGGALYVPTHTNLTDLGGSQVVSGGAINNRAITDGFGIGDPVTFTDLTSPETVTVAIIYRMTDGALVAWNDDVDGFPFTPIGGDYVISPTGPSSSWFAL